MVEKRKLILYFLFFSKIAPRWGRNGTCSARFDSNSPKRTLMGQTGPREIGANLAFGVNLALFILQCTF